jgi:UDP-N-acetylglucosamine transferase subunit ALG13
VKETLVAVVVGTDHHRFDRLMGWIEGWARSHAAADAGTLRIVVQHGSATPPAGCEAHELLGHQELQHLMGAADVIVCHGGPATIMEARRHGHLPIVVPRNPAYGEHVDEHQMLFARRLADSGMVRLCTAEQELYGLLDRAVRDRPTRLRPRTIADPPALLASADVVDKIAGIVSDLLPSQRRSPERSRRSDAVA